MSGNKASEIKPYDSKEAKKEEQKLLSEIALLANTQKRISEWRQVSRYVAKPEEGNFKLIIPRDASALEGEKILALQQNIEKGVISPGSNAMLDDLLKLNRHVAFRNEIAPIQKAQFKVESHIHNLTAEAEKMQIKIIGNQEKIKSSKKMGPEEKSSLLRENEALTSAKNKILQVSIPQAAKMLNECKVLIVDVAKKALAVEQSLKHPQVDKAVIDPLRKKSAGETNVTKASPPPLKERANSESFDDVIAALANKNADEKKDSNVKGTKQAGPSVAHEVPNQGWIRKSMEARQAQAPEPTEKKEASASTPKVGRP